MSEGDRPLGNRHPSQYGGGGAIGGPSQPRQPNSATQSKVLSIVSKNRQDQAQQSGQPQPDHSESIQQQPSKQEGTMRQLSLPVAPSGLRASAAEFIPKAYQQPPPSQPLPTPDYADDAYYYQGQEGNYAYNQEGADYFLGNNFGELTLEETYEDPNQQYISNYSRASLLERFDLALKILTTNPSTHEEYLKPICDEIVQRSAYDTFVPNIVEDLYLQCIMEENFRYIGARICQYLNSHLKMEPNFIKRFVKRCQEDFDKREKLVNGSPEDKKILQGLGMLLAEILLNVETSGSDGTPQRLGFLPPILIKTVDTLLSNPEDANIKCCCQMLKLSGPLIEDVVKTNPDHCISFELLFDKLYKLSMGSQISQNAKFHVDKIVELKEHDWEASFPAPSSNAFNPYAQNQYYGGGQDPVYYDTPSKDVDESGSHLLTEEEEADFLAWQYEGCKQDSDMGFEMEEAYEEFLRGQSTSDYNNSYHQRPSSGAGTNNKSSSMSAGHGGKPKTTGGGGGGIPPAVHHDPYHYYSQTAATNNHHQQHQQHHHHRHQQPQQHHHHPQQQQQQQQHYPQYSTGGNFYPAPPPPPTQENHFPPQQQQQQQQQHQGQYGYDAGYHHHQPHHQAQPQYATAAAAGTQYNPKPHHTGLPQQVPAPLPQQQQQQQQQQPYLQQQQHQQPPQHYQQQQHQQQQGFPPQNEQYHYRR